MSTTRDPATPPSARWSVGGVFLEALTARDYQKMASTFSGGTTQGTVEESLASVKTSLEEAELGLLKARVRLSKQG